MTNDAKLGLVLGVAIVLVIGLVFFRAETQVAETHAETIRPTPTTTQSTSITPTAWARP